MATWNSGDQEEEVLHGRWSTSQPGYGGGVPPPQKSKRKKKCAICAAVVLGLILIIAIAAGVAAKVKSDKDDDSDSDNAANSGSASKTLVKACNATLYPDVCYDSLKNTTTSSTSPIDIVKNAIAIANASITQEHTDIQILYTSSQGDRDLQNAALDCTEFLQSALDSMSDTLDEMKSLSATHLDDDLADLQTWMSAALTNQETCKDGLEDLKPSITNRSEIVSFLEEANRTSKLVSNALAFVTTIKSLDGFLPSIPGNRRRLLNTGENSVTFMQRRLLQSTGSTPNLVVALDGSGQYQRIQDAITKGAMQEKTDDNRQYVIYIKAGIYNETVLIPKTLSNIVVVGDGIGKTIISGSLSVIGSNVTTSKSATMTVQGKYFVGRDFTVENTAGAANHQAVALRVTSDHAAFQNCSFVGYQDTLYTHTNRQFFINCTITGTVDFIFGNAAVVFQYSQIIADTGLRGQQNTYTASGRMDPKQNTGLSFQQCTFDGTPSLKSEASNFPTYLGRPWKPYARVVVMQSDESAVVAPAGWLDWNGQVFTTAFFAEYDNRGSGSGAANRVPWSKQLTSTSDAQEFTVDSFLNGESWLPQSKVLYQKSL